MHKQLGMAAIFTLFTFHSASAQTPQWVHQFGTTSGALAVSSDGLGGIYASGFTAGLGNPSPLNGFLSKFDESGAQLWFHQFGDSDLDTVDGVSADKLGNVFVSGRSPNTSNDNSQSVINYLSLNKYDASGNLIWAHQFGQPAQGWRGDAAQGSRVVADGLGNAYVAGYSDPSLFGPETNGFLAKVDSAGNLLWGTQNVSSTAVQGLSLDGAGNVYLSDNNELQKYSSSGSLIWTKTLGLTSVLSSHIAADALGDVFVAATTSSLFGGQQAFLYKYDPSGSLIWSRGYFGPGTTAATDIFADGLGNVFVTGQYRGPYTGVNVGQTHVFLWKYDSAGNEIWSQILSHSYDDYAHGVFADGTKGAYVVGSSSTLGGVPGGNAFIAKFAAVPEPTAAMQALSLFIGTITMKRRRSFN
jgi:hypothetical protein